MAEVRGWVADGNLLIDYPDAEPVDGSILVIDCDIALPAALEGTLTDAIATQISARLVVEGANGPTTPTAEQILHDRNVAIVPDLVANGGGVVSSYFEWAQNHQRIPWTEIDERRRVLDRLDTTFDLIATQPAPRWRDHALGIAITRVTDAMTLAGQVRANHGHHRPLPPAT